MADFKLSLLMTAIMSCLITGCGGGGHHSSNNESQNWDATEVTPTSPSETQTSPSETPSETIAQQNSKLEVQVIDGYLTDLDVCIVNDKLECNDVFGKARTDENGKASFDLNDEQKKIARNFSISEVKEGLEYIRNNGIDAFVNFNRYAEFIRSKKADDIMDNIKNNLEKYVFINKNDNRA